MKRSVLSFFLILTFSTFFSFTLAEAPVARSAQEWKVLINQVDEQNQKRLRDMIENLNIVSIKKIEMLARQSLQKKEPVLIVIKSQTIQESWYSIDSSFEMLNTALAKSTAGTGFALVTVGLKDKDPAYFIIGDQLIDLSYETFQSLKCADMMDSYIKILQQRGQYIRETIKSMAKRGDLNYDEIQRAINIKELPSTPCE